MLPERRRRHEGKIARLPAKEKPLGAVLFEFPGEQALLRERKGTQAHHVGVCPVSAAFVKELVAKPVRHAGKRVPIVNKTGDLVGIVSRANLIQVVASAQPKLEMTLTDSAIRQKLLSELKKQSWAHRHNVDVTVSNGCVDIWGYAQSDAERDAIRVVAESIPGVVTVNDHLANSPVFAY